MLEKTYQAKLVKKLYSLLPDCIVLKNDSEYMQGIPDLLVLFNNQWAALEVKRRKPAPKDFEPNQEYYLERLGSMSFAACVYPENEEEVINALLETFRVTRSSRIS